MKINCGPTPEEQTEINKTWHRWFAWRPVRVASHDCRWLETIERKGTSYGGIQPSFGGPPSVMKWRWEYRAIGTEEGA